MSASRSTSGARRNTGMDDCCCRTCSRYSSQNWGFWAIPCPGASTSSEASVACPSRIACAAASRSLFSRASRIESSGRCCPCSAWISSWASTSRSCVRSAPFDPEEHRRIRIVEARDLLGVEVEQQRPEMERVGEKTEEPVRRLQSAEPRGRQLLVELGEQIGAHLLPAPHRRLGRRGEAETGGLLDRGAEAVHQHREIGVAAGLAILARLAPAGDQHRHQREPRGAPHQRPSPGAISTKISRTRSSPPVNASTTAAMLRPTPKGR